LVSVTTHLCMLGLYLPPVFSTGRSRLFSTGPLRPPQTIISVPVHTAVCSLRPAGAPVMLVANQLSVLGLYLPPVCSGALLLSPPQTIISVPVHTAVKAWRPSGALSVLVAFQQS